MGLERAPTKSDHELLKEILLVCKENRREINNLHYETRALRDTLHGTQGVLSAYMAELAVVKRDIASLQKVIAALQEWSHN